MRNLIVLIVFLFSLDSFSQDSLYVNGGSVVYGSVIHINKGKVWFEDSDTGKRKWYKKIDRLIDDTDGKKIEFKVRDIGSLSSSLSGEVIKGKASYYIAYKHVPNNGYSEFGYIFKEGDKKVLKDLPNSMTTPFYKRMSKYFSDCDPLVAKINKKEFKLEDTMAIIEFYNSNCGQ